MSEWIAANWEYVLVGIYAVEKIVKRDGTSTNPPHTSHLTPPRHQGQGGGSRLLMASTIHHCFFKINDEFWK